MRSILCATLPLVLALAAGAAEPWVNEIAAAGDFPLAAGGRAATLVVSPGDFKVVGIAAGHLADDIGRVAGARPTIAATAPGEGGPTVLIGTLGHSPPVDALVAAGNLDVTALRGAWESFVIGCVDDMLVIAGSDRRGTAYGVYELSQAIGVSPWHWWADVAPRKRPRLFLAAGERRFGPPSVKYRGIFINDEDWGLQPWAAENFEPENGGIGPKTYAKVFELLLRLKANTLWPAMHECTEPFNGDPRNAALADDYAIVMGSSHAEPMLRNNVREWTAPKPDYNYVTNRGGVRAYWEERVRTNRNYENIYTVGMRGIHDSAIQGTKTDAGRIAVLEQVFADQRAMLAEHVSSEVGRVAPNAPVPARETSLEQIPQMFCAYKEVLELYRQGLRVPDDVTIVWPDDNFGYVRNFASGDERKRSGGFGVYYHISYLGRPLAYLWLCTTPPALIWEEMRKAYDHGADRIWIVNVGDIKPAEIGTEFFLNLAWDIDVWEPDAQPRFLRKWAVREFGEEHADAIAGVMGEYYRLNFRRKPEHLQWWLPTEVPRPSPLTRGEIEMRLAAFSDLRSHADAIAASLAVEMRDAFEQLVGYPVRGSALANTRYFHGECGEAGAALAADAGLREATRQFNEKNAGGKWRGFMRLEPADDDWRSMRIAPWKLPEFPTDEVMPVSPPEITRDAGSFDRKNDTAEAAWTVVRGLGRSGSAVTVLPFNAPSIEVVDSATTPRLEYDIEFPDAGVFTLRFELLPTHPLVPGRGLRFAITLDEESPREVVVDVLDGSAAWAQGVLDNRVTGSIQVAVTSAGSHCLKVFMVDAGVVIDSIRFERSPTPRDP